MIEAFQSREANLKQVRQITSRAVVQPSAAIVQTWAFPAEGRRVHQRCGPPAGGEPRSRVS
jgi:hypothetical protein